MRCTNKVESHEYAVHGRCRGPDSRCCSKSGVPPAMSRAAAAENAGKASAHRHMATNTAPQSLSCNWPTQELSLEVQGPRIRVVACLSRPERSPQGSHRVVRFQACMAELSVVDDVYGEQ